MVTGNDKRAKGGRGARANVPLRVVEGEKSQSAEVLTRIKQGGKDGAAVLFNEFGEGIDRLVWRLLGADDEHNDVVNQVYVEIMSCIDRVRHAEALGAWIRSVIGSACCTMVVTWGSDSTSTSRVTSTCMVSFTVSVTTWGAQAANAVPAAVIALMRRKSRRLSAFLSIRILL